MVSLKTGTSVSGDSIVMLPHNCWNKWNFSNRDLLVVASIDLSPCIRKHSKTTADLAKWLQD